jgi:hypothetical protein
MKYNYIQEALSREKHPERYYEWQVGYTAHTFRTVRKRLSFLHNLQDSEDDKNWSIKPERSISVGQGADW